LTKKHLISF